MLILVGLGIWDEKDLSLRGLEACRRAKKVYCELYTAAWGGDIEKLGKLVRKDVVKLERKDVEEGSDKLLEEAKDKNVVLLVPGDPLVATTHVHLVMDAKEKGVPFGIIHSSSIYTAVAKTGLQLYKFGRTSTVITPKKGYESEGFYDAVVENHKHGMHTLLLLDVDMGTKKALEILKGIESKRKGNVLKELVLCSRLGSNKEKVIYGKIENLMRKDLPCPAVVIVPGKMHFMEKEFLETLVSSN